VVEEGRERSKEEKEGRRKGAVKRREKEEG
jgi:hypothetical protein